MTNVGKGGGAGGPAKGLAPAHFFPLEGTAFTDSVKMTHTSQVSRFRRETPDFDIIFPAP